MGFINSTITGIGNKLKNNSAKAILKDIENGTLKKNAQKYSDMFGNIDAALGTNLSSNFAINTADIKGLQKSMQQLEAETSKALKRHGSIKGALTADYKQWDQAKWDRIGLKNRNIDDISLGQSVKAAFLNNDGSISKANVAGAYMGANMAVNGHLGIPLISDSDREVTSGTTSALVGGGAYALARKFL